MPATIGYHSTDSDAAAIKLGAEIINTHLEHLRLNDPYFATRTEMPVETDRAISAVLERQTRAITELAKLCVTTGAAMQAKATATLVQMQLLRNGKPANEEDAVAWSTARDILGDSFAGTLAMLYPLFDVSCSSAATRAA